MYFFVFSCLKCVRVLQQNGHLPSTASLFKNYAQYGMFIDARLAAIDIIAEFLKGLVAFLLRIILEMNAWYKNSRNSIYGCDLIQTR